MMEMAGQRQNIIQVVATYGSKLFGFIRSRVGMEEDAEDILQDVWQQLSSQAKIEDIQSISGWLYRVARNKIIDVYRKENQQRADIKLRDEGDEWIPPALVQYGNDDAEVSQMRKIFRETLIEALEELPPEQRSVFIRNELEDMTLQEIADQENENIKTIISRKRYATRHLRKRLEFLYDEFLND